jgi:hypothetical protein
MIYNIDRYDLMIMGQFVLPCKMVSNYEEAFEELKNELSSKKIVDYIIEEFCLDSDLFEDDETYKFDRVEKESFGGLNYYFKNSNDEEVYKDLKLQFVTIL